MRILVHGMQSSGASLVAYFLAQMPHTIGVVDLYCHQLAPSAAQFSEASHAVLKSVVTSTYSFTDHAWSFAPDRSILVLRHPYHNYVALSRKPYRNDGGVIDQKFRLLDDVFRRQSQFDAVLVYEDFVMLADAVLDRLTAIGIPVHKELFLFPRSREAILAFNRGASEWCDITYQKAWSFGNIRDEQLRPEVALKYVSQRVRRRLIELCPETLTHMENHYKERGLEHASGVELFWHDAVIPSFKRFTRKASARIRPNI